MRTRPAKGRTPARGTRGDRNGAGGDLAGGVWGLWFVGVGVYGFDDGLYCGARLLESHRRHADPGAVLTALPDSLSTPELQIPCAEGEAHALIGRMLAESKFPDAQDIVRIDGLRVEYPDGFGLARASNTPPVIGLRFRADTPAGLVCIQR